MFVSRSVPDPFFAIQPLVQIAESIIIVASQAQTLVGIVFFRGIETGLTDYVIGYESSATVARMPVLPHQEHKTTGCFADLRAHR